MKKCSKCNIVKNSTEFKFRTDTGRLRNQCKDCDKKYFSENYKNKINYKKEQKKKYYKANVAEITLRVKNWKLINTEKISIHRMKEKDKSKTEDGRRKARNRIKKLRLTSTQYRLRDTIRRRVNNALKNKKIFKWHKALGCDLDFLKCYIENKFLPGMTWENHGNKGWHIDHIIPLAKFDLTIEEQFNKAFHYTNLQPLWAIDNLKKGRK